MRGSIFYENLPVETRPDIVSSGRPVVVVSKNLNRATVQVVPITSNPARHGDGDPMHVPIIVNGRESTVLCEQIRTVRISELRRFPIGYCSESDLKAINIALGELLGLSNLIC